MLKGALVAFGIMVALALIPLANLVGIPFGPFIGGYFGITFAGEQPGSYAVKGTKFGVLLALVALAVSSLVAVVLTRVLGLSGPMLALAWLGAGVFTMYTGSMGALGAMYSLLRAERQVSRPEAVAGGK
jgi:hypothetical protein